VVICGGIIPYDDIPRLKEAGIKEVFQPGTTTEEIIAFIKAHVARYD
jgi:methylmalonyl-CoA mutase C-terminal domain/subunit